ncbi:MAG: hypothetical protein ACJ786_30885 [Catenulispora sp.]
MSGHSMDEDEIRGVLGEGIGEEPPIVGGPAAVFAAARARVVRTRVLTGALSTVAVLGVAAGAVAFGTGAGGGGGQSAAGSGAQCATGSVPKVPVPPTDKASPSSQVTAASPGNSPSGQPPSTATSDPRPGRVQTDPQSQLLLLKQALPCGTASGFTGYSDHQAPGSALEVYASLNLSDRLGVGNVRVDLVENASAWIRSQVRCDPQWHEDISCEGEVLKDGTLVKSIEYLVGSPFSSEAPGGKLFAWTTQVLYPDGRYVVVSSSNFAPRGKESDPTRKVPPLTRAQVRGIALDVAWTTTVTKDFDAQAKREITPFVDMSNGTPAKG